MRRVRLREPGVSSARFPDTWRGKRVCAEGKPGSSNRSVSLFDNGREGRDSAGCEPGVSSSARFSDTWRRVLDRVEGKTGGNNCSARFPDTWRGGYDCAEGELGVNNSLSRFSNTWRERSDRAQAESGGNNSSSSFSDVGKGDEIGRRASQMAATAQIASRTLGTGQVTVREADQKDLARRK
jgi:hypothetical protein